MFNLTPGNGRHVGTTLNTAIFPTVKMIFRKLRAVDILFNRHDSEIRLLTLGDACSSTDVLSLRHFVSLATAKEQVAI